jgi:glycosyltransferase involved in cell wall biosynthesis
MKIRLALIIDTLRVGGTEKQLVEIVDRLDSNKIKPIVIMLRPSGDGLSEHLACENHILDINSFMSLGFLPKLAKLVRILKENQTDIVQTFFPEGTIIGVLAAKLAGVPVIVSTRRDIGSWHNIINRIYIKISNLFVHRILVNSRAVEDYVIHAEKFPSSRIDVIYNGVDSAKFDRNADQSASDPKQNSANLTVGIVSNFERPVKRFDIFISAANKLKQRYNKVTFLIVGRVSQSLQDDIPEDLLPSIQLTGVVKNVCPYLRQIDIGVICSDSEGFCNVILEYMAAGVPVVCTDAGGNPELVNDGIDGCLFDMGDSQALFEKLVFLVENPLVRSKYSELGMKKVAQIYNWPKIMGDWQSYYTRLLKKYK